MLGEKELINLFPDFKELVQPSGIDLRLDEVFRQVGSGSLIDNEKNLPELEKLEPPIYTLKAKTAYLASIDRKIKIPKGFSMLYLPRSTLLRSFVSVHTAVGDPGFYGTLQFMIHNYGDFDYTIKQGERIAQGVVFPVTGSGEYNGSYQEEESYQEKD
jgi:dUTP pyrophosphatase